MQRDPESGLGQNPKKNRKGDSEDGCVRHAAKKLRHCDIL
ncbi:hypothetical protein HMPREF1548_04259 [Clostridium sp. KLE 1755]|nr:hypothetical protein HMPREF1548_04259 [Clostridium sp. KLE 1755]